MPPPPSPSEPPSRLEVVLTAFVFPGAGQLMQGRWLSAVFFLCVGLVLVVTLCMVALLPLFRNLGIMLGMWGYTGDEPLAMSSIPAILASAGLLILVHIASIIDAAIAYRNRRLHWLQSTRPPM